MSWHFRTRMMYVFTYFDVVLAHHWVIQSRFSDAGLRFVLPQEAGEVDEEVEEDLQVDPFTLNRNAFTYTHNHLHTRPIGRSMQRRQCSLLA